MRFALVSLASVLAAVHATTDINDLMSQAAAQISDYGYSDLGQYYSDLGADYGSDYADYLAAVNDYFSMYGADESALLSFYGRSDVSAAMTAIESETNVAVLTKWYNSFYSKYRTDLQNIYTGTSFYNPFSAGVLESLSGLSSGFALATRSRASVASGTTTLLSPTFASFSSASGGGGVIGPGFVTGTVSGGSSGSSGTGQSSRTGTTSASTGSSSESSSESLSSSSAGGSSSSAGSDSTKPLVALGALLGSFSFLLL